MAHFHQDKVNLDFIPRNSFLINLSSFGPLVRQADDMRGWLAIDRSSLNSPKLSTMIITFVGFRIFVVLSLFSSLGNKVSHYKKKGGERIIFR
jgi:hypothetical protein